ncbi:DNA mismatch repair protein pms1 [Neolecta irregularis DAH-3]|uniref:DNA mismatch repair protein PMS1 n=1 Tax=Neolecta irregularis (strain DAH-3) TaxID=1198029 RepID=A0A1U7LWH3_NEOID|nr:DNA mismatch repair protein pms1 [Neolecta irregularis DAH-3]|eukprot:OLL27026.1 DNA mismatch repair protein pms1 [Neolecta irregularis DAH-3]
MECGIRPIGKGVVHNLCAGQVVIDLCTAVKELVENSLDSGASTIEVRLGNYGLDFIQIQDNGVGIEPADYENIALKHFTSKLSSFEDLESVTTFGFRGEALSSLCALADVYITTATKSQAPKATRIEFSRNGKLVKQCTVSAQKGTSIDVQKLFYPLPVRRKEFERNCKKEYAKTLGLLQSYAVICEKVKLSVYHQASKGKKHAQISTQGKNSMRENIANVFGSKILSSLIPLDLKLQVQDKQTLPSSSHQHKEMINQAIKITGFISKPIYGEGRGSNDRQMYFINSRLCSLPKISRTFNDVYRLYNQNQSPFVVANINLATTKYDVNVSPDKRTIFLHEEDSLCENLREKLTAFFDRCGMTVPKSQVAVMPVEYPTSLPSSAIKSLTHPHSFDQSPQNRESQPTSMSLSDQEPGCKSQLEVPDGESCHKGNLTIVEGAKESTVAGEVVSSQTNNIEHDISKISKRPLDQHISESLRITKHLRLTTSSENENNTSPPMPDGLSSQDPPQYIRTSRLSIISRPTAVALSKQFVLSQIQNPTCMSETESTTQETEVTENLPSGYDNEYEAYHVTNERQQQDPRVNLEPISEETSIDSQAGNITTHGGYGFIAKKTKEPQEKKSRSTTYSTISSSNQNDTFDLTINLSVTIDMIANLSKCLDASIDLNSTVSGELLDGHLNESSEIAEQRLSMAFNLGFIIASLSKDKRHGADDLFIIDQHASDEKYNFERIQSELQVKSQPLVRPVPLQLSAIQELLVTENIELIRKNGFQLLITETEPVGRKFKLYAQPMADLEELLHLIEEHPGQNVKCSKWRSYCAMRACRSSIMIGDPLPKNAMQKVVQHLGHLDKPWVRSF